MVTLYGFDCDGTIEEGNPPGPIRVEDLHWMISKGDVVYLVSPSPACRCFGIPRYSPILLPRWKTLLNLKAAVQTDRYVYVGDMQTDADAAAIAGWEFMPASEFLLKASKSKE